MPLRVLFVRRQNLEGGVGRVQDADPCGVVEVGIVWGDGAKVIENAKEGINHELHAVGFSLVLEELGDQRSCAGLVDGSVVDQPVNGGSEVWPPVSCSPVLLLIVAVAEGL